VAGLGVGRGYLNNPDQTSAAFVPNPFDRGERFYRTGDVGRYRPDGVIEFHGRVDFQVKIRGFRVELGEIEARLARCAGVKEAIVLARDDQTGNKRLIAYLTGTPSSVAELRRELATQLADYMIPAAFVTLESFPLTPNGKIDRNALPEPDMDAIVTRPYEPALGEVEETVARIWRELLGLQRIGRQDHFFELGGSSLLATQVIVRLRKTFDVEIPLIHVFQYPVLAELAEAIVMLELKKFESTDVDLATEDIRNLTDEEIDALLAAERDLTDSVET
jgi:acyl carrier protein